MTGRYYIYRENPPLVRVACHYAPLFSVNAVDYNRAGEGNRSKWDVGMDLINANGGRYRSIVERCRCSVVLLGVACAALVFWWISKRNS